MHADACEATRVRGEQSQELLDLRMACLDDRLTQLGDAVRALRAAPTARWSSTRHGGAVAACPSPCADAVALRAPIPPPADLQLRQRLAQIREQIARANALVLVGQFAEGLRLVRAAAAAATPLRYAPVEAEAQLALARIYDGQKDYTHSVNALHEALVFALAGHHDEVQARAALGLLVTAGERQQRLEQAEQWAELAEAAITRLSRNDRLRGELYAARAVLLITAGAPRGRPRGCRGGAGVREPRAGDRGSTALVDLMAPWPRHSWPTSSPSAP